MLKEEHLMSEISGDDIYLAYKKLKNYVYYDNSSVITKYKIAEWEEQLINHPNDDSNIKDRFSSRCQPLIDFLNSDEQRNSYFDELLDEIHFKLIPKDVDNIGEAPNNASDIGNSEERINFLHNIPNKGPISVSKLNIFIEAPVEIHLISVLWVMFVGRHLNRTIGKENYAYQFNLSEDDDTKQQNSGYQLFKPYYRGYQEWRNNALDTAKLLLDKKQSVTIVSLDIKRYFYSVRININNLFDSFTEYKEVKDKRLVSRLNNLLQLIHEDYTKKIKSYLDDSSGLMQGEIKNTVLPVGLLSSGFLGNLYLCSFDRDVKAKLNPDYYGRYVDDLWFVFKNQKFDESPNLFIKNIFENHCLLERNGVDFVISCNKSLSIQQEKVSINYFDYRESRAALNIFIKNLKENRSEFRFLPDEDEVDAEFEEEAFDMNYNGSVNKLRSIEAIKENKFGVSKYLAQKIFLAQFTDSNSDDEKWKNREQLLSFFNNEGAIKYISLWEKVATYFIVTSDKKAFTKLIENICSAIDQIRFERNSEIEGDVKIHLKDYLNKSIAVPLAMHPTFIDKKDDK